LTRGSGRLIIAIITTVLVIMLWMDGPASRDDVSGVSPGVSKGCVGAASTVDDDEKEVSGVWELSMAGDRLATGTGSRVAGRRPLTPTGARG
jgi:hypothetical protein